MAKRMLIIANPAAQNGAGQVAAQHAAQRLAREIGEDTFDVCCTQNPLHAIELAQHSAAYDVVVALGGDGVIHEVLNGLMGISAEDRPILGVIPVGSGNDFAYTLGLPAKLDRAIDVLLKGAVRTVDVGQCGGEYFVQTMSFGLDAAIAHGTIELRKRTGRTGTLLYLESGINQIFHHLAPVHYEARLEGVDGSNQSRNISGDSFIFAVQNGPTYGGHFKVCPQASPDDGLFDICIAHPPLNAASATGIFLLAKEGHHTHFRQIEMLRARAIDITFDHEPAAQMDGEMIAGTHFHVTMVPQALRVIGA